MRTVKNNLASQIRIVLVGFDSKLDSEWLQVFAGPASDRDPAKTSVRGVARCSILAFIEKVAE